MKKITTLLLLLGASASFATTYRQTVELNVESSSELIIASELETCFKTTDFFDGGACVTLAQNRRTVTYNHGPKNWFLRNYADVRYHPTYEDSCYGLFHSRSRTPEGNGHLVIHAHVHLKNKGSALPEAVYSHCTVDWIPEHHV